MTKQKILVCQTLFVTLTGLSLIAMTFYSLFDSWMLNLSLSLPIVIVFVPLFVLLFLRGQISLRWQVLFGIVALLSVIAIIFNSFDRYSLYYTLNFLLGFPIIIIFTPLFVLLFWRVKLNKDTKKILTLIKIFSWASIIVLGLLAVLALWLNFPTFYSGFSFLQNLFSSYMAEEIAWNLLFISPYALYILIFVVIIKLNKKIM